MSIYSSMHSWACAYTHHMHEGAHRDQKMASDTLELDLQVERHHVGVGNQAWVPL